ncbi:MAG TPA: PQQ-binding-like beta-propeller repeat protein [Casimicrobiaceae bacterium]|nr:PQQ-binding-like beta-propeller repeat protein [Casimicrobiaceae bacterium]
MRRLNIPLGRIIALAVVGVLFAPGAAFAQSQASPPAAPAATFQQHCAACHENPATRAPSPTALRAMSPDLIVDALTNGLMKLQGSALSPAQRTSLAEYLTGRKPGAETPMAGRCTGRPAPLAVAAASFNGWSPNVENWRYQPAPGIAASQLPRLEVKWVFGFPGAVVAFGQPTIAANRVFVGSQNGHVYALDARSGCYYWDYAAGAGVRTAVVVARIGKRIVALFGDRRGYVYSVDAATGRTVWKVLADDTPHVQVTGSPTLFEGKLYVPTAVGDDSDAIDPRFECCRGRGAVVALDAATGKTIWTTHTLPEAVPQGRNGIGTQLWGPSGASIWAAPTIDRKRRALYVGTGDNHSAPATAASDAVLALALDSGRILWTRQLTAGDMGNNACFAPDKTNCPEPRGPDADLGDSANLITLASGRRVLTIGQKSGMVWALDPDDGGRIVWQTRVGKGGVLGGVQWGLATDGKAVYAAVSDIAFSNVVLGQPLLPNPEVGGGLHALDPATGATRWTAPPSRACANRSNCSPAQSAAVTATPEYVLSGSVDGHIRAYSTADGALLWDYDTAKPFATVNGVKANGGSIDAAGPTLAGGMLLVGSGYGLYGGQPGNVLIAFSPRR